MSRYPPKTLETEVLEPVGADDMASNEDAVLDPVIATTETSSDAIDPPAQEEEGSTAKEDHDFQYVNIYVLAIR